MAKCRQPFPERSSSRSIEPPGSTVGPCDVAPSASMNCQCSARVASEAYRGLATIDPVASTPRSQVSRSTWLPVAMAR